MASSNRNEILRNKRKVDLLWFKNVINDSEKIEGKENIISFYLTSDSKIQI